MVNKCSVTGCKSLYVKDNVKLHRFPLTNAETLPLWVTATGREKDWKPCKSSRLCGNHFRESEYIVGHGKGVLKSTAIPTIEYRVNIPRYTKRKYQHLYDDAGNANKHFKIEQMPIQETDSNVEIVQLDYNDIYESKYEYQNKDNNYNSYDNHEEPCYTNEFQKMNEIKEEIIDNNSRHTINTFENYYNKDNDTTINDKKEPTHVDKIKKVKEIENDICNRENQCYMFTSSFQEGAESIGLTPPENKPHEGLSNMNIDQSTANSSFKKIMSLKLRRQRRTKDIYSLYFESLTKENVLKPEQMSKSLNDDTDTFGAFIVTQLQELRPYKKLYVTTKHQIQKILMKAQLKIAS